MNDNGQIDGENPLVGQSALRANTRCLRECGCSQGSPSARVTTPTPSSSSISFIWGSDYNFTNCTFRKNLELFLIKYLARGVKFKGFPEILVGEISLKFPCRLSLNSLRGDAVHSSIAARAKLPMWRGRSAEQASVQLISAWC